MRNNNFDVTSRNYSKEYLNTINSRWGRNSEVMRYSDDIESCIFDLDKDEEMLYYDLKLPREKRYYFAINRETLETDGKLLKDIKEKIKNRIDGLTKVSYGIFSTNYDANYGYCRFYSSLIQTEGDE